MLALIVSIGGETYMGLWLFPRQLMQVNKSIQTIAEIDVAQKKIQLLYQMPDFNNLCCLNRRSLKNFK